MKTRNSVPLVLTVGMVWRLAGLMIASGVLGVCLGCNVDAAASGIYWSIIFSTVATIWAKPISEI
ncbi:hypothetical protein Ga0100231_023840 [Opitutaceae bacterium TAV4]|nr:hypothetical protein Ga0100231_023840 [Opitutaceae bacterium TAV4]RRK00744.1 hypothetical protein Ga0100230_023415 [Opitutaceae bacterium TAV3]